MEYSLGVKISHPLGYIRGYLDPYRPGKSDGGIVKELFKSSSIHILERGERDGNKIKERGVDNCRKALQTISNS